MRRMLSDAGEALPAVGAALLEYHGGFHYD